MLSHYERENKSRKFLENETIFIFHISFFYKVYEMSKLCCQVWKAGLHREELA